MTSLRFEPVVPPNVDGFWEAVVPPAAAPLRLVVVTRPYDAGSVAEKTLQNLLAACKLPAGGVATQFIQPGHQPAWHHIRDAYRPDAILLLGVLPAELGVQALLRLHAATLFDGAQWVPTLTLEELSDRKEVRQALWTDALKPLFAGS